MDRRAHAQRCVFARTLWVGRSEGLVMRDATRTVMMDERMWRQITRAVTLTLHNMYLRDMTREAWKAIEVVAPEHVSPAFDFASKRDPVGRTTALLRRAIKTYLRVKNPQQTHEAMREVIWKDLQERRQVWAENGGRMIAYRVMRFLMHMR